MQLLLSLVQYNLLYIFRDKNQASINNQRKIVNNNEIIKVPFLLDKSSKEGTFILIYKIVETNFYICYNNAILMKQKRNGDAIWNFRKNLKELDNAVY